MMLAHIEHVPIMPPRSAPFHHWWKGKAKQGRRHERWPRSGVSEPWFNGADKRACCTISLPKRGLGKADRDVHTYRSRVRPGGHERVRIRRQASIVELSLVEDNGEPFSATGVETESLHGAILRPRQAQADGEPNA
jgi:hypothetical protein